LCRCGAICLQLSQPRLLLWIPALQEDHSLALPNGSGRVGSNSNLLPCLLQFGVHYEKTSEGGLADLAGLLQRWCQDMPCSVYVEGLSSCGISINIT
jgi:hypothetical protein